MTRYRLLLSGLALCAAGACTDPGDPRLESGPNHVRFQSDPGDPVGVGQSYDYTPDNAVIELDRFPQFVGLSLTVTAADRWSILFFPPDRDTVLVARSYENTGWSFPGDPESPKLSVVKESTVNACTKPTGRFVLQRVEYVPDSRTSSTPKGVLAAIDATFEQRCAGATGSLRGTIHWRAQ